ncbi:MAG TPA: lasso peptide biosynthesis B2 protein [Tepidisphaeraceae bacterium]|jgi:hypothetical protein|nr:lasso peptide biosynthesis B2 protein [Tepidisphaeraceae bacterium]
MGRLVKYLRRPRAQQRLLLQALLSLTRIRLSLWLLPYHTVSRWTVSASQRSRYKQGHPIPTIDEICQAITAAARFVPGASCLTQALTGQILFGQAGHAVTLQIGVLRKGGGPLQAHAWLESAGRVILGNVPELSQMQPLRAAS